MSKGTLERTSYDLSNRKVAIVATDGFEASELLEPLEALRGAGANVEVLSVRGKESIQAWEDGQWGEMLPVDGTVDEREADDFDGLVIPGGVMNPDKLRMNDEAVAFVRDFFETGKPVAAICHGPWMVVEAEAARGRKMTSYPSLRTDIENAGGDWIDEEVVVDAGLVTSRGPDDLEAFIARAIEEIHEGVHAARPL